MEHSEHDPPPGQYQGLRLAEINQLSMDYTASPEAFEAVRLFCGKYVDERAALGEQLAEHQKEVAHINANQLAYFEIFDEFGLRRLNNISRDNSVKAQPEAVMRVAHGAAGAYMIDLKHAAAESLAKFLENADGLSALLAAFCQEELAGERLLIMGTRFEYKLGFLSCVAPDKQFDSGNTNRVYGTQRRFITLRRQLETGLTGLRRKQLKYAHADAEDWQILLTNLDRLTQF